MSEPTDWPPPGVSVSAHGDASGFWQWLPEAARPDPSDPHQWSDPIERMQDMDTTTDITEAAASVLDRLAAEIETPVYSGLPLPQGDLIVLPADGQVPDATEPIPTAGMPLVRGDGGHVHLLLGRVAWAPRPEGSQTLGTVTVPGGEVGYLAHGDGTPASALSRDADHALVAFGPGTYVIRRQREQADTIRLTRD